MPLETARHLGRKCTGHKRLRGWYLVSVQLVTPTSFYLFSGKLEYLNKIIWFNTFTVRMKMNPCEEIRRRQMPQTFQEEMKWLTKGFHQPKTRREMSSGTIDAFQAMIWDKPVADRSSTNIRLLVRLLVSCFVHSTVVSKIPFTFLSPQLTSSACVKHLKVWRNYKTNSPGGGYCQLVEDFN